MKQLVAGLILSATMMTIGPSGIHAQTRADSITAFAETIMSGFFFSNGEKPILRLAELPSLVPDELIVPPEVRVAGSVEFPSMSFIILDADQPEAVSALMQRSLEQGGWELHETPQVPGDSPEDGVESVTYCRDRLALGLGASKANNQISIFYMTDPDIAPCTTPSRSAHEIPQSPIPRLSRPSGARPLGSSGGGSSDHWYSAIALRTDHTLEELRRHYVDQLESHGFVVGSTASNDEAILVTVEVVDSSGQAWTGTASFTGGSAPDNRHVQIFLVR